MKHSSSSSGGDGDDEVANLDEGAVVVVTMNNDADPEWPPTKAADLYHHRNPSEW